MSVRVRERLTDLVPTLDLDSLSFFLFLFAMASNLRAGEGALEQILTPILQRLRMWLDHCPVSGRHAEAPRRNAVKTSL